jgi:hypothetical protein
MPSKRRFPPPWAVVRTPGGWRVDDGTGRPVAYVYGRDDAPGANDQAMTVDEARRIAVQIARLPKLLDVRPEPTRAK